MKILSKKYGFKTYKWCLDIFYIIPPCRILRFKYKFYTFLKNWGIPNIMNYENYRYYESHKISWQKCKNYWPTIQSLYDKINYSPEQFIRIHKNRRIPRVRYWYNKPYYDEINPKDRTFLPNLDFQALE